jgi:hypothetical protein
MLNVQMVNEKKNEQKEQKTRLGRWVAQRKNDIYSVTP